MLYFFDHHNANLASLTEIEETNSQEVCMRFRLVNAYISPFIGEKALIKN